MYEKFEQLIAKRGITTYRVAKDTGIAPTVFSDCKAVKIITKVDKIMLLEKFFYFSVEFFLESLIIFKND